MGLRAATLMIASLLFCARAALADDRFTVCGVTINSDDEIRLLQRTLPSSHFRFVELTDYGSDEVTPATTGDWLEPACRSGVRCDVLVVSGHFGNTWAGDYGTTFAGSSGASLALADLERNRCDSSCSGILDDPLEVFLLGCQTMATRSGETLSAADLGIFARHGVAGADAERIADEIRNRGDGTSTRQRMRFVFAGAPHIYGFTDVAPAGVRVAPLLEQYLKSVGDYAAHLRRLRQIAATSAPAPDNQALAAALAPTCFVQSSGLLPNDPGTLRGEHACVLRDPRRELDERLRLAERLLDEPAFLRELPIIQEPFHEHDGAALRAAAPLTMQRIQANGRARRTVLDVLQGLDNPPLRVALLRIALSAGWIDEREARPIRQRIVARLLRAPVYGESRDLVCALRREVGDSLEIRAADVEDDVYRDEFGIQALACLKPSDPAIHQRLGGALSDSREWVARMAAIALREIKPDAVEVQVALANQLGRAETGLRSWAQDALRVMKPSHPRVLAAIEAADPTFEIDWR